MPSPEEIHQSIVEELGRIRSTVTDFLERIEPQFAEHLQDDTREAGPEIRQLLDRWSKAGDLKEALDRLMEEVERQESPRESSPIKDDAAFQAITAAGVFATRPWSIDARVDWEITLRGFERKLHPGWRNWANACKALFTNLQPRVQTVVSWLTRLISQMRTPKEWSIAGQINGSPFGVGLSGQISLTYG